MTMERREVIQSWFKDMVSDSIDNELEHNEWAADGKRRTYPASQLILS